MFFYFKSYVHIPMALSLVLQVTILQICSIEGRLELYMKQNHENVERAEKELNALHEDMEQTLELQRRLAQRYLQLRIY